MSLLRCPVLSISKYGGLSECAVQIKILEGPGRAVPETCDQNQVWDRAETEGDLTQFLGTPGVLCGTFNAEMAAVEGFRTVLYSTSLAGFIVLESFWLCVFRDRLSIYKLGKS